jgi:hypothetical protein
LNPTAASETGPIPPAPALATPSTPSIPPPARVHDFNKRLPILSAPIRERETAGWAVGRELRCRHRRFACPGATGTGTGT